ncbi:hypothetical protein FYJ34_04065 [Clostridiaceae bacterium 68-1-5]|uniref:Uncharacterized protein n=1 Tax=Suipraeoptans intestinalis TaxID=2606628 RepID=A0A6N7V2I7_9FIRM|nr:hypothetical protein [Suipraeoptans intestinalis]MSR93462.1 hypothetical protein [Suipraeoptans intestinalis]
MGKQRKKHIKITTERKGEFILNERESSYQAARENPYRTGREKKCQMEGENTCKRRRSPV